MKTVAIQMTVHELEAADMALRDAKIRWDRYHVGQPHTAYRADLSHLLSKLAAAHNRLA